MKNEMTMQRLRNEDKNKKCPECGGELVFEGGEVVCKKCGLVAE